LNIKPSYKRGMELEAGRYHIEVSHPDYETKTEWVQLEANRNKVFPFVLTPIPKGPQPGDRRPGPLPGMEFAFIPPGSFMMGSALSAEEFVTKYGGEAKYYKDEHPRHQVTLTQGFYMQTTEVTQGQWKAVMGKVNNPSDFIDCGDNCPVENVSWDDVQGFIKKLNQREGRNFRLPTEAEWEYAARAGTTTPFAFGNCLSTDQANYNGNYPGSNCAKGEYRKKTIPVAGLKANVWGLYDMHGNVWEWCQDWHGDYPSGSATDPKGPSSGSYRVLRGGSWIMVAWDCQSAIRIKLLPVNRGRNFGFRLVLPSGQ
jgi:sulfatase modifying factor 1